jgi:peptide/nickel transport system substrate-binding protein
MEIVWRCGGAPVRLVNASYNAAKAASFGGEMMKLPLKLTAGAFLALLSSSAVAFAQDDRSVRIVLNEELDVVEPCMAARSNVGRVILQNVNESLTEFEAKEGGLLPRLATKWEQLDDKTWRFTLREGVKFHDGSAFDPADIAFTLDRIKTPEFACEVGTKYFGDISFTTKAIDDRTIEITTEPGSPILPLLLSTVPIQPDSTPKGKFTTKPIGTGPYVFSSWDVGQSIVLDRYVDYWGEQPQVEKATYLFRTDSAVAAAMVEAGEADIVPNIAVQDATNAETDFSYPNSETSTLRIDTMVAPLNDRRVREAANLAIDREAMRGSIFAAEVKPATQQVPPTTIGFTPDLEVWPYDPERAKQLLAEAKANGVPVDTEIKMIGRTNIYPNATEAMEAMMAMLQDVGFNVSLQMYDVGEWNRFFVKPFVEDRVPSFLQAQHDNAKGDPVFTAFVKHHSQGAHSMVADPKLDRLIEDATAASGDERTTLWKQVFARANDEIIVDIPMFYMVGFTRVSEVLDFMPTIATNSELQLSQIGFK